MTGGRSNRRIPVCGDASRGSQLKQAESPEAAAQGGLRRRSGRGHPAQVRSISTKAPVVDSAVA